MKQLLFMIPAFLTGTVGSFFVHPYLGFLIYYLFAVLRPQWLWEWSLPSVAWSFYVAISAGLATIAWRNGLLSFDGDDEVVETNIAHYCMFGFSIWIVVTYFTAYNRDVAYEWAIEYFKIFIMFIAARFVLLRLQYLWVIFVTITIVLCYIAYEINEIYISLGYLFVYRRGYCGLDNNGAALMLAMGVPFCLYMWDGLRHWVRWIFLLFIPVIIHAVLTSYSRGAMLALVLTIPIYLVRCKHRVQLLIVLMAVGVMLPYMAGKEIQERFFSIEQNEIDESAKSRRNSWAIAIRMANENPIFGLGVRNSNLFTFAYGADIEGRTIHSQWLQIAADSGYPALILYIATFLAVFYCCSRVRRAVRQRTDLDARKATIIANGSEGSLLVFAIGGTFLSLETFELPYVLFLLGAQLWAICQVTNSFAPSQPASEESSET